MYVYVEVSCQSVAITDVMQAKGAIYYCRGILFFKRTCTSDNLIIITSLYGLKYKSK